jgi:hypothetical protein
MPVLMQIGGEWLVAGGESAEVTGDEAMFALGTSQLIFLAGNVLQVSPILVPSLPHFEQSPPPSPSMTPR